MRYEAALEEADKDAFCFPTATIEQLQYALETLTHHDKEPEPFEEVIEELVEEAFDWEELEEN